MTASKFAAKWEGPYVIHKVYNSGYFLISKPDSSECLATINAKWLKQYYH